MTNEHALDPTIELRLAARHASIPLHDFAARLSLPVAELRGALLTILLTSRSHAEAASPCPEQGNHNSTAVEGEGREREERPERFPTSPNVTSEKKKRETFTLRSDARETEVIHQPTTFARYLATLLDDEGSLSAYELLVDRNPPELLLRALDIVERTPRERIRGKLGAYFTGTLANLAKGPPQPYARSSSTSP